MSHQRSILRYGLASLMTAVAVVFTVVVAYVARVSVDGQSVGLGAFNLWWLDLVGGAAWARVLSDVMAGVALAAVALCLVWQVVCLCRHQFTRRMFVWDVVLILLVACYGFFQIMMINYRPIPVNGVWEVAYPSSHVLLLVTVCPLVVDFIFWQLKAGPWRVVVSVIAYTVMVAGVLARAFSGYHWLTDILGGILWGAALLTWYYAVCARMVAKHGVGG